jgi:hypothetical protein
MTIGWIEEFVCDGQVAEGFKDRDGYGLTGKCIATLLLLLCLQASYFVFLSIYRKRNILTATCPTPSLHHNILTIFDDRKRRDTPLNLSQYIDDLR